MKEALREPSAPLSETDIEHVLEQLAAGLADQLRSPVLHWPDEAGLDFEQVSFPALDGVPLEGWFVPAAGSRKLIIVNHPMGFSRSGLPADVEPWRTLWASSGNDFEVNFVPDLELLHLAGYNVLTYDLRNLGLSGAANGGIASSGIFEARDVAGSIRFAATDRRMRDMTIGLFSRCLGCNSTMAAAAQFPQHFAAVKVLVGAQPVTTRVIMGHQLRLAGVPDGHLDDLDARVKLQTGINLAARHPQRWATHVKVPTLFYGVHDDVLTEPDDLETMHHALSTRQKSLRWIHGTTKRWDGYLEFQRRPEPMLDWFLRFM